MSALAPVLQGFFTEWLAQRQASPHTVASYRDTFCLLLRFAQQHLGKPPYTLEVAEVDASLVGAFLDHLETESGNAATTRNNRLAAVHSLFSYAALRCPEHAATIGRVLAIPPKRTDTTIVCFLTRNEVEALLTSPDRATWLGRRDHLLLLVAVQTGLRVSELTGLTRGDVTLGVGANLRCQGKGAQGTPHPADPPDGAADRRLADRMPRRADRPAVPEPGQRTTQHRRRRGPARQAHRHRHRAMPVVDNQASLTPHAQTHSRDVPPARGRRHLHDRTVAGLRREAQRCIARAAGRDERRYLWI